MISENSSLFSHFPGWQVGYGAFTYSISAKHNLIGYVENQREHHKIFSFKEELTSLLKEHFVDYNDNYLLT
jgi:hypothetical protein